MARLAGQGFPKDVLVSLPYTTNPDFWPLHVCVHTHTHRHTNRVTNVPLSKNPNEIHWVKKGQDA